MGDKHDFEAMISYGRGAAFSRRQFAALSVGAGLTSLDYRERRSGLRCCWPRCVTSSRAS